MRGWRGQRRCSGWIDGCLNPRANPDDDQALVIPDWIGSGYSDHPRVDAALPLAHHIADLSTPIEC
jgi:hypothetical protein